MDELEKNRNKRKIYISLLATVVCLIAVSYAFFTSYLRQSDDNKVTALVCFSTTLTNQTSAISLTNEFPISNSDGLKKTPYSFKVTNNCSKYIRVYITIDSLMEGTTGYISSNYMKGNVSLKGTTAGQSLIIGEQNTKTLDNEHNGYILLETGLNSKESKEFDLRLWVDYDTTAAQGAGLKYQGKIVVVSEPDDEAPDNWNSVKEGTLLAAIKNDPKNKITETLTVPGREISGYTKDDVVETRTMSVASTYRNYYWTYGTGYEANGTNFNLTGTKVTSLSYTSSYNDLVGKYLASDSVSSNSASSTTMKSTTNLNQVYYVVSATSTSLTYKTITSNKGVTEAVLSSTEDDYGTSYYFRGAVKNNYVEFANMCWRIVRITGNGGIKLALHNQNGLYSSSGSIQSENPCSEVAGYSGATLSDYGFNDDAEDNAYIGFMYGDIGATSYAATHANKNKSRLLINLETWYNDVLSKQQGFTSDKLADTIWCNDKSTANSGLGYGTQTTNYMPYYRINTNNSPSLICPNDNNGGKLSKFTADDNVYGNGELSYKIGALTVDEVAYAGGSTTKYNLYNFLSDSFYVDLMQMWYATLSPADGNPSGIYVVDGYGSIMTDYVSQVDTRPAISLNPSVKVTGSGTADDPYIVQ